VAKKSNEGRMSDSGQGKQTREEIVSRAMQIAAHKGLGALSIGSLAKQLNMSKSGLFVHFGSKESLEAAVVERAAGLFFSHVLLPADEEGLEGIERVWALCDDWLHFVEKGILPGGSLEISVIFLRGKVYEQETSYWHSKKTSPPPCRKVIFSGPTFLEADLWTTDDAHLWFGRYTAR
jgi:AcrR family transcriptional regulator